MGEQAIEDRQRNELIEEYRATESFAVSVDQRVFQLAAVLVAGSVGVFVLVAGQEQVTIYSLLMSCFGAVFSTGLAVAWYYIMRRFSSFISVAYYRAREIETELGFWKNRYIHHLDNPLSAIGTGVPEEVKARFARLEADQGRRFLRLSATTTLRYLVFSLPLFWFVVVSFQTFFLFAKGVAQLLEMLT